MAKCIGAGLGKSLVCVVSVVLLARIEDFGKISIFLEGIIAIYFHNAQNLVPAYTVLDSPGEDSHSAPAYLTTRSNTKVKLTHVLHTRSLFKWQAVYIQVTFSGT